MGGDTVLDAWQRYRQLIWDEQIAEYARFPERARDRPFDPEVRAAAAWDELGDRAWAEKCLLGRALASVADGSDVDAVLETLDAWLAEGPPPVRRAKLLTRAARILLDAGDNITAGQRADEAAAVLNAAGFTDPVTAGSAEDAFAVWVSAGHRERVPGCRTSRPSRCSPAWPRYGRR